MMTKQKQNSLNSFKEDIKKVKNSRHHKITESYGVYDSYSLIRKNKWYNIGKNISTKDFYNIVRTINKFYAEQLSSGKDIILPHRMGMLELRKLNSRVDFKDGKMVTNREVDWDKTLELWYEDEYCKNKKQLVRVENDVIYRLCYNKSKANYNNKTLFKFRFNRNLKKMLKNNIVNIGVEAFNKF